MGPRAGSEPGGWRAATQTGPSPHSRPIRSPPPPGHCSGSQASVSFRGPRPTCSLHGPRPSVKAPPLQGCRRNLPGESKQPGNTRAGEQAVRRTARALLSPGDQAPLAGGRTARLRLWGAEWRPRLVPRPYRQGQLEYVTSHAQGGPGTLGGTGTGAPAPDSSPGLCTPSLPPSLPGRSQRTEESATRPVTCTGCKGPNHFSLQPGRQAWGKPGASPAP